jgi:tetratricopeptide (TPR) repeat protein
VKHRTKLALLGGALIVLATLAAYWPALRGGFIWDDDAYVTNNPLLTAPDGLKDIWFSKHKQSQYFPLAFTTLRLEHALWGLNPLGYHLVNVLLHGINALLAWAVLRRLAVPGAWLAAAIFALHPVQVESAAWITEIKNVQSTLFYLLALLAWIKCVGESSVHSPQSSGLGLQSHPSLRSYGGQAAIGNRQSMVWYGLTLVFYALALFSKTTACTFPAAMVLTLWLRKQPVRWQRVLQIAPFVLMGLAMGLVSIWWEAHLGNYQERFAVKFGLIEQLLIASRALWFYLGKLAWPTDLAFSYPRWEINPHDPAQYLWGAGCIAVALFLWTRRRRFNRGVAAAPVFFAATLFPMLGFFPLYTFYYTFVADHYQYLACLGPIALFAAGLSWLAGKWRASLPVQGAGIVLLLVTLGTLTWRQAGAYQSPETLWRDTLRKNPGSWLAHNNLGMVLAARGDRPEAETHYREAIRLKPDNGDAHYNLANLLFATGRREESAGHYQTAARLIPEDADMRNNLGVALHSLRRTDEAAAQFREAIRLKPKLVGAHFNLGLALETLQRRDEAIEQYREVLRHQPDSAAAKSRLRALGAVP